MVIDLFNPRLKGGYNFLIYDNNWFIHSLSKKRGINKSIIKKDLIIDDNKLYSILLMSAE